MSVLLLAALAHAAPLQLTHQGRLADSAGQPLQGAHQLGIALYADPGTSTPLWSETIAATLEGGVFSVVLGANPTSPLDSDIFNGSVRWVGLRVDGGAELPDRIALTSVPYALRASAADTALEAEHAERATSADSAASAASLTGTVAWSQITGAPADADALAALACASGEVPTWSGSAWACGSPAPDTVSADTLTGTVPVARLPVGSGPNDVAAGDHTHGFGQITGLAAFSQLPVGTTSTTVARGDHGHALSDLTGTLDAARLSGTLDAGRLPATLTAQKAILSSSLRLGADSAACTSAISGSLRWASSSLELCDGTAWRAVQLAGLNDGSSATNAGTSCKAILADNPGRASGVFWIDPDASGPNLAFRAYCDMTTAGGGWTILANNHNGDAEPTGCLARLASDPGKVCGSPAASEDFALLATGLSFRELVWAAYASNFGTVSSYQYFTWPGNQSIPATSGDWHLNAGGYNQTVSGWESLPKIQCNNSYNRLVSVGSRVAIGGYYGGNRVTKFTAEPDAANWSMSFTDVFTTSGQGNFQGLDDFQDGYGCSDEWSPKADRGKSSFIMVR